MHIATADYEGAISDLVTSFEVFMVEMIKQEGFQVSEKSQFLSPKTLWLLNDRLHFKSPDVNPRSTQIKYPLIHLLHNLARSGKFGRLDGSKGKIRLVADEDFFDQFCELSLPARYVFLLEIFWTEMDLNGFLDQYDVQREFHEVFTIAKVSKPATRIIPRNSIFGDITAKDPSVFICGLTSYALWFFGFFEMELPEDGEKRDRFSFPGNFIEITLFGKLLTTLLFEDRPLEIWNLKYRSLLGNDTRLITKNLPPFHQAFNPIFGEGNFTKTLDIPKPSIALGVYRLKISLSKDLYRVIDIPADASFSELHDTIQELYEFDDDHLYSFYLGKMYSRSDPGIDGSPSERLEADDITLGSKFLFIKQSFRYVFDFGDNWQFTIKVMDHFPDQDSEVINLVKSVGDAPEQYPDWDDED